MYKEPVVILANGNYPTHIIPVQKIKEAGYIICCDGAVNNLVDNNIKPNIIIGDLDSLDPSLTNKYRDKTIYLPNQDENDLQKSIRWAESEKINEVTILGATGKRDDHSISNIFILLQLPTSMKCTLFTDYGCFSLVEGKGAFQSFKGQQVSLFAIDPEIEITSTNLKYSLICTKLTNLYKGSLNECKSDAFTLSLSHGKILTYQVFA